MNRVLRFIILVCVLALIVLMALGTALPFDLSSLLLVLALVVETAVPQDEQLPRCSAHGPGRLSRGPPIANA